MGTFDNSISALKSKLSKIAEATRALSGSTKKLSLDEIPNIILQNSGTFCYYLGMFNSKGQIDVKSIYPNDYQKFTIDNFIICSCTVSGGGYGGYNWNSGTETCNYSISARTPSVTYSNGILIITNTSTSGSYPGGRPDNTGGATVNLTNIKAYLVSSKLQSSLIYLGTGTSFNVSSISGYQNFTTANFLVVTHSINESSCDADEGRPYSHGGGGGTPAKISSYNASTGQVTVSPPTSYVQMSGYTDYARNGSNSGGSWSVYLLVGSIKSL